MPLRKPGPASRVTFQAGVVQPDVARIVVSLAGGRKLTLQPYPLDGQRWVAFAVPVGLTASGRQVAVQSGAKYNVDI